MTRPEIVGGHKKVLGRTGIAAREPRIEQSANLHIEGRGIMMPPVRMNLRSPNGAGNRGCDEAALRVG
jgi:hypothetical protein